MVNNRFFPHDTSLFSSEKEILKQTDKYTEWYPRDAVKEAKQVKGTLGNEGCCFRLSTYGRFPQGFCVSDHCCLTDCPRLNSLQQQYLLSCSCCRSEIWEWFSCTLRSLTGYSQVLSQACLKAVLGWGHLLPSSGGCCQELVAWRGGAACL